LQLMANGQLKTTDIHCEPRVQVLLHGILDLLVRRDDGLTLIVDTKTVNQWNAQRQAEYDNHGQMKAYAWAVPRIRAQAEALGVSDPALARLPEVVHGCMPNVVVIRKPYAREGSASKPNALARNEFHRLVTTYTPERLEEWRVDALAYIEQTFRYVASGHWPQNEKHCSHHYGKKCAYCDVCFVPKVQRQIVLESDLYMDYARGPLAEVKEEKVEVGL
jgi:RecB family exonuclease